MLRALGSDCLDCSVRTRLEDWLKYCLGSLTDYHGTIPLIDTFIDLLHELSRFIEQCVYKLNEHAHAQVFGSRRGSKRERWW